MDFRKRVHSRQVDDSRAVRAPPALPDVFLLLAGQHRRSRPVSNGDDVEPVGTRGRFDAARADVAVRAFAGLTQTRPANEYPLAVRAELTVELPFRRVGQPDRLGPVG